MSEKIDVVMGAFTKALENDPKLSVARLRLLLAIRKFKDRGTTAQIASELGINDTKYFRKFAAEAEKSGYIQKERFNEDPSAGDCLRFKLTTLSSKLLKEAFSL